ncbi:MAG: hypothetical protein ACR2GY_02055 [Phycisphaerales bacterium]
MITVGDRIPDLIALLEGANVPITAALEEALQRYTVEIDRLLRPEWERPVEPSDATFFCYGLRS